MIKQDPDFFLKAHIVKCEFVLQLQMYLPVLQHKEWPFQENVFQPYLPLPSPNVAPHLY